MQDGTGVTSSDLRKVLARSGYREPTRSYLSRIKAPVLLLAGAGDKYFPVAEAEAWEKLLQESGVEANLHTIDVAPL